MIAQVMNRNTGTLTAPAGWTHIRRDTSGTEIQVAMLWKVATGSETPPTFTLSMPYQLAGGIVSYSGVDTTAPIHADAGAVGNSATVTAPSVTTTRSNTQVVRSIGKRQEVLSAPPGTTQRWSFSSGGSAGSGGVALGDVTQDAAGATGYVLDRVVGGSVTSTKTVTLTPAC